MLPTPHALALCPRQGEKQPITPVVVLLELVVYIVEVFNILRIRSWFCLGGTARVRSFDLGAGTVKYVINQCLDDGRTGVKHFIAHW